MGRHKLVQAGTLDNPDERHSAIWENEGSGADCVEFHMPTTVQDGWKARGPDRVLTEVLEPEPPLEAN